MFFNRKSTGIKLSEYFVKKQIAVLTVCLIVLKISVAKAASVNVDTMIQAFNPLIDLMQALSFPIAFLMIVGGFLLVIIGQRHKGIDMIKWASVGYIGVQFVPAIMRILMDVGKAMRQAQ